MSTDGAIIGVADHSGWAVLVTVSDDGTLLDRRRVELLDEGLPRHPHHHDGQKLPIDEGVKLVERVRVSADRRAKLALDDVAAAVSSPILAISIRECPELPPTVAERITNYRAQCVADSVMFRQSMANAAEARGWAVRWYDARRVLDAARDVLEGADLEARFAEVRRAIGPPWGKDEKVAMAAAIVATHGR